MRASGNSVGVNLDNGEGTLLLRQQQQEEQEGEQEGKMSMRKYKALTRWLALCGLVQVNEELGPIFKKSSQSQKVLPLILPLVFVVSTVLQDVVCYGVLACDGSKREMFGDDNITYNNKTAYGWVGLLVAASALHVNVLLFARSGKLETLFHRVPSLPAYNAKVRNTIGAWVLGWVVLVVFTLAATIAFILVQTFNSCGHKQLLCIIPQSIQIVSGLSMVCTGVGLSYLISLLVRLDVLHTQEKCVGMIVGADLRSQLQEYANLKSRIKQLGKDTQIGNCVAFCAACVCIFGSLWGFSEYYADKQKHAIFSISLWMCLISLLLTFLAVFSFSNVTQACDDLMECIRDEISKYVIRKDSTMVTLSECFIMISSHQQRFGFEIMGILVEPEIVRAGAYAGVTAAAAILKLAI